MYCSRCGTKLVEQANFCKNCGNKIENSHHYQYDYSSNYSHVGEDDLQKAYVGSNYEEIKNTKFSIPSFFLGFYYMLYRKMWLLALLYLIVTVAVGILTFYKVAYVSLISLGFIILVAVNFSKIYLYTVEKRIEKIKQKNSDKSNKELLEICRKKGGVSIGSIILSICIIMVISIIFVIWVASFLGSKMYESMTEEKDIGIEFYIPAGFSKNYVTYAYQNYSYRDDQNDCEFTLSKYHRNNQTPEEYLQSHIYTTMNDQVSEIKSSMINGDEWKYIEIEKLYGKEFHYIASTDSTLYKIDYTIHKDNKICSDGYNKFINSLKIIEKNKAFGADSI